MYDLYYLILKPYWGKNVHFQYMHTDSFVFSFDTQEEG